MSARTSTRYLTTRSATNTLRRRRRRRYLAVRRVRDVRARPIGRNVFSALCFFMRPCAARREISVFVRLPESYRTRTPKYRYYTRVRRNKWKNVRVGRRRCLSRSRVSFSTRYYESDGTRRVVSRVFLCSFQREDALRPVFSGPGPRPAFRGSTKNDKSWRVPGWNSGDGRRVPTTAFRIITRSSVSRSIWFSLKSVWPRPCAMYCR